MFEIIALCAAIAALNITFGIIKRRSERGTWSRRVEDNRPHEAGKKAG